jgi:hypothetical protein
LGRGAGIEGCENEETASQQRTREKGAENSERKEGLGGMTDNTIKPWGGDAIRTDLFQCGISEAKLE